MGRATGRPTVSRVDGVLVWMDLEMTGLDPTTDLIVEIATLVTDAELNIVAEGPDLVINVPDAALDAMSDVVRAMHAKSGLTDEIRASTITLEQAGAATLDFVKQYAPEPRTAPLCGNSIGTDRRFLLRYLPEIEQHLHYRCVDVSTIKELAQRWYPDAFAGRPDKSGGHRALGDILDSVAELRYYRSTVFVPQAEPTPPSPG